MIPIIWGFIRSKAPFVTFPVALVFGFIGYHIENIVSDKYTPSIESVKNQRDERFLREKAEEHSLKDRTFVPKTIFERNLSPSLQNGKEIDTILKQL